MEEKSSNGIWKIGFFSLLALLVIGANIFAWYFFVKGRAEVPTPSPAPSPVETIIATPTPREAIPSLPTPTVDETSLISPETSLLIKQAIFKLTGLDETRAEVTISQNTGQHATGGVKEFEAVGGAYWIAAKVGDTWVGVYAGQANPTCAQIAPYNFPISLVPECLDESNNVVKR